MPRRSLPHPALKGAGRKRGRKETDNTPNHTGKPHQKEKKETAVQISTREGGRGGVDILISA